MSNARQHFEQFKDHTLLKHAILRAYLERWARILLSAKAGNHDVVFIDCFAGPGHDRVDNVGSPVIAAETVRSIRAMSVSGTLPPNVGLRFAAVEKETTLFADLRQAVSEVIGTEESSVRLFASDYRDCLTELAAFRRASPCLTFIDPFGVSGLDAAAFPVFLAGAKSEVLILVSGIGAARLHGVLGADGHEFDRTLAAIQSAPSLFPEMQEAEEARLLQERDEYIEALDATKPRAHEALLRALGSEQAVESIQRRPRSERPAAFVRAIAQQLRDAGASHVVSVPMRDENGAYKYTLLHASKSERAVSAMKASVSEALTRDDLSETMRSRIQADLTVPIPSYVSWLQTIMSGRGDYWAWGRKERRTRSFQEMLLETTPLFNFQVAEVKKELKGRGLLSRRDGREWVEFP